MSSAAPPGATRVVPRAGIEPAFFRVKIGRDNHYSNGAIPRAAGFWFGGLDGARTRNLRRDRAAL